MDSCNYTDGQVLCGDVCIYGGYGCFCGEEDQQLSLWSGESLYCCVNPSEDNKTQCDIESDGSGHCPQGTVLDKAEACNSTFCYNDYDASLVLGFDSHYRCGEVCVIAHRMCRGYSLCRDNSDVTICDKDMKCVKQLGEETDKSYLETDLSDQHFFCNYEFLRNEGEYNTISRKDETNLDILTKKVMIDYNTILECKNWDKFPGFMCGETCYVNYAWCREDLNEGCKTSEEEFSTSNKRLCTNTTFWENQICDFILEDGDILHKVSGGERCSGGMQHCSYPWYISANYFYEVGEG